MRVAVFIKSTTFNKSFGGLETQNKLLCEGLAERGCSVIVISPKPDGLDHYSELGSGSPRQSSKFEIRNSKQIRNPNDQNSKQFGNLEYLFVNVPEGKYSREWWERSWEVFQKLHQEKPFDVVVSQSMAGQAIIARRGEFKVPVVVIQHGTILGELKTRWRSVRSNPKSEALNSKQAQMSKIQNPKRLGHLKIWILNLFRISNLGFRIYSVVRDLASYFLRLVPYGIKIYFMDQWRLRRADVVIAVSDQVRDALIREYFLPPEKITVVHNGAEIERFGMRNALGVTRGELGISEDAKVLLYVGRVEKEKGLSILLQTVFRIPHNAHRVTALIVGNGPYLADLKSLAGRLGVTDRVRFVGRVSYDEVPKYYAAADVFVLPSLREEGLPMTLPEAMASGLPIVASRIGGIPNAVKDGETGILVEPGNVEELTKAIIKVVSDDGLRARMSSVARGLARKKFSQQSMVEGTLGVMRSVLN